MAKITAQQWAAKSLHRLDAVWKTAAQEMAKEVQTPRAKGGNMPVDTGFLRNSFHAANGRIPSGGSQEGKDAYNPGPISIVINRAKMGDRIVFGWVANYAPYMESRYAFLRSAAQNWEQIVRRSAIKVRNEVNR